MTAVPGILRPLPLMGMSGVALVKGEEPVFALRHRVLSALLVTGLLAVTSSSALANYSVADTSGQLYVQGYTHFANPSISVNSDGGPNSCQTYNHINETMWFDTDSSQAVPQGGAPPSTWLEVGEWGGLNLGNPMQAGCDIGFYYENHPAGGNWQRYIPTGVSGAGHDYWERNVSSAIGSTGVYAIIDGVAYTVMNDQWCCSANIEVGLEISATNFSGWSLSSTDDTPLDWYDLNWNVSSWRGCTVNGFPNNCSLQDSGITGYWANVWNDYHNSLP